MASDWPPAPPEGYRLHDPEYDQPWYVTGVLFIRLVGVVVVVPALVINVHGLDTAGSIIQEILQPNGLGEWLMYLGWIIGILDIFAGTH